MKLKEAKELSIQMWTWLAKTGDKYKSNWPELYNNCKDYVQSWCFLCQYVYDIKKHQPLNCKLCPLYGKWGSNDNKYAQYCCERSTDSPYRLWFDSPTIQERKKYARKMVKLLKTIKVEGE